MAGNVQEWCWNRSSKGNYLSGGSWSDPQYRFQDPVTQKPFARFETQGLRCAWAEEPFSTASLSPVEEAVVDFNLEKPVDDARFALYRNLYEYDRIDLDPVIESVDEQSPHYRAEKITFNAAYGGERVIAHLFLPRGVEPPYQVVVFFPGSGVLYLDDSSRLPDRQMWDFVPRGGRALLYPIYKYTYERRRGELPSGPMAARDRTIEWTKDVRRCVDYLETRDDIDAGRIAYLGLSMGSTYAPFFLAMEDRFAAAILVAGGLYAEHLDRPGEAYPLNFVPRCRAPVLMINGRYDLELELETAVKPMFALFGAGPADKRLVVEDADHVPSPNAVIRESLDWLDRYLGPVN
jgi:hypothetical protein